MPEQSLSRAWARPESAWAGEIRRKFSLRFYSIRPDRPDSNSPQRNNTIKRSSSTTWGSICFLHSIIVSPSSSTWNGLVFYATHLVLGFPSLFLPTSASVAMRRKRKTTHIVAFLNISLVLSVIFSFVSRPITCPVSSRWSRALFRFRLSVPYNYTILSTFKAEDERRKEVRDAPLLL